MDKLTIARGATSAALLVFLIGGALLRIIQFADKRSLWLDEAALADSILSRPLGELLARPLAYDQVAPPGFLAAVKGAVSLFGRCESALRLWSACSHPSGERQIEP